MQRVTWSYRLENVLYRDLMLIVFATLAGFTSSGILANIYRIIAQKPEGMFGRVTYLVIMAVAGPNFVFENAAASLLKKESSRAAFWMAAALAGYWSFTIGLLIIAAGIALRSP